MEKEKEEDVWSRKMIGWQRSRNTLKIGPPSDPTFWNRSNCLIYLPFRKLEIEKKTEICNTSVSNHLLIINVIGIIKFLWIAKVHNFI